MAKSKKVKKAYRHSVIPLSGQILIEQKKTGEQTEGGLYLPESQRNKPMPEGVVVACAKECEKVKVGDKVMFPDYVGFHVNIGDRPYLAMHEDDVFAALCVIEEETDNVV
jgi:chaperonin GroES